MALRELLEIDKEISKLLTTGSDPETVGEEAAGLVGSVKGNDLRHALIEHALEHISRETANRISALISIWELVEHKPWKDRTTLENDTGGSLHSRTLPELMSKYLANMDRVFDPTVLDENASMPSQEAGPSNQEDHEYTLYNFDHPNIVVFTPPMFRGDIRVYKDYRLITGGLPFGRTPVDLPRGGVCLDDHMLGFVCLFVRKDHRHQWYPADFDSNGDIRKKRLPLGFPMLIKAELGEKDIDNEIVTGEGYYYARHKGQRLLCGKEGLGFSASRLHGKSRFKVVLGFKVADFAQEDKFGTAIDVGSGEKMWPSGNLQLWYKDQQLKKRKADKGKGKVDL